MRLLLGFCVTATVLFLVACGGGDDSVKGSALSSKPSENQAASLPKVLPLGDAVQVSDGLTMAPLSLKKSTCDSGQGLSVEVEWNNKTAQFIKGAPSITVTAPDNQTLNQYAGIRGQADGPAYDGFLPQGFPPNQTVHGFLCIPTGGQKNVSTYVGALPASFTGWTLSLKSTGGQTMVWAVK